MIGELAALGAAICWTVSAVFYKEALLRTKPFSANIVRCLCTSMVLVVCFLVFGKYAVLMDLPLYIFALACISGVIGLGLGDTLYMKSLKLIGVARAVPVTCVYPLFNLLIVVFLQGKTVTLHVVFGTVAIVFGVWLLSQEERGKSEPQTKALVKGVAYALATAVIWAISIAMISEATNQPETDSLDHAFALNTVRVFAAAVFLLVSALVVDRRFSFLKIQRNTLAALGSGGIVALALGWFLLTFSFVHIPQSQAVPISSTTPLFATLSGMLFLHEPVTTKSVAGSAIIVIGIFIIFTI